MQFAYYLWLVLYCFEHANGDIRSDLEELSKGFLTKVENDPFLPMELGIDRYSGCICRATADFRSTVCFGNYVCKKIPKIKVQGEGLKVRTAAIVEIRKGDLECHSGLITLGIDANHQLRRIEPGSFRNMSKLEQLSISHNTGLVTLDKDTFKGLKKLRILMLINNGFKNLQDLTPVFRPMILPALAELDLSENSFERVAEDTFVPMEESSLRKLDISLCQLDYIHPNSFTPLKELKQLTIGQNDLNATLISQFLVKIHKNGINLTHLDISGMGFRKKLPRELLDSIAKTSIKCLFLSQNQFEVIADDAFPQMPNIELLDLRKVNAMTIGPNAFEPPKFPKLKILLLSGNNFPGLHQKHLASQLMYLDLSNSKESADKPMYFEMYRDTFVQSEELRVLNLSYNKIKAIFNYTFRGLGKLKVLNLENGTIFFIGADTFKATKSLEVLNLANNILTANENLTSAQFNGLNELKILHLRNCALKKFYDDDNIFEMMPKLTHLDLKNNQLFYITAETLKPLKFLKFLDLSDNLIISWWKPLFLSSGIKPHTLLFTNNKISHFSMSMIQDISYLLEEGSSSTKIDFMDNVFVCDCSGMYDTYLWLERNGSLLLKNYFATSNVQCSSPDIWEDRKVTEYLSTIKNVNCLMNEKISNMLVLVWTAPSLITLSALIIIITFFYKYRLYMRYWLFLAKMALGRKFMRQSWKSDNKGQQGYKYDAFVSYSYDDREFMLEMIANLENNPPHFKLCVAERDFEVGSFISEAILNGINESRYVILLISNSFAKSQWCRWETQLAEYHRMFLEEGSTYDPLVLVRLGDVDHKILTPTLKYLLKTKIYLLWDCNNAEIFWKKMRSVLTKK